MSGPVFGPRCAERLSREAAGMTLIEASAGTGKTRELTGIVARLVVEDHRRLDEILVVTFTRAATAELRDRIRHTLRSAHRAVVAGEAPECSQAAELLAGWREDGGFDPEAAGRRLEAALQDIDRANVFTIHGFCQRVLADLAFDGGFPFGFEVSGDAAELVARAARDFWRRHIYPASKMLAGYAVDNGVRPDDLAGWLGKWRAKPDLRLKGGAALEVPVETREAAWQGVLDEVRAEWERHREPFRSEVLDGNWLNRRRYARPRVERELAAIEDLLDDPEPLLPEPERFGRYGATALADACKKGHELPENPLFAAFDRAGGDIRGASRRLRRLDPVGPTRSPCRDGGSRCATGSSRTGFSATTTCCWSCTARFEATAGSVWLDVSGATTPLPSSTSSRTPIRSRPTCSCASTGRPGT